MFIDIISITNIYLWINNWMERLYVILKIFRIIIKFEKDCSFDNIFKIMAII